MVNKFELAGESSSDDMAGELCSMASRSKVQLSFAL